MESSPTITRFTEHRNAFGFLRLLFASLVIVAHTPELLDGDQHRELLHRVFGSITFGGLAVDGFFSISGFLIVGSYLQSPRLWPYLKKRIARIYPAFIVSSVICVLIVAPLGGAAWDAVRESFRSSIKRALTLSPADVPGVFPGTHHAALNGSMWTIAYEFRCYLLIAVLGWGRVLKRPWLVGTLAALALLTYAAVPTESLDSISSSLPRSNYYLGDLSSTLRLTGVFLFGGSFYLWRDRIQFTRLYSLAAVITLLVLLFVPVLADSALATFGAYLIFAFAAWGKSGWISRVNNRNDISYGVYLYAWPIGKSLIWWWPTAPVATVAILTALASYGCGWASWSLVEKPIMQKLRGSAAKRHDRKATVAPLA